MRYKSHDFGLLTMILWVFFSRQLLGWGVWNWVQKLPLPELSGSLGFIGDEKTWRLNKVGPKSSVISVGAHNSTLISGWNNPSYPFIFGQVQVLPMSLHENNHWGPGFCGTSPPPLGLKQNRIFRGWDSNHFRFHGWSTYPRVRYPHEK